MRSQGMTRRTPPGLQGRRQRTAHRNRSGEQSGAQCLVRVGARLELPRDRGADPARLRAHQRQRGNCSSHRTGRCSPSSTASSPPARRSTPARPQRAAPVTSDEQQKLGTETVWPEAKEFDSAVTNLFALRGKPVARFVGRFDPDQIKSNVDFVTKYIGVAGTPPPPADMYATGFLPNPPVKP